MNEDSVNPSQADCNEDYTGSVCLLHSLTKKFPTYREVLVDIEDFEWLATIKWYLAMNGRNRANISACRTGGKYMHRDIMRAPPETTVDHKFHRRLDNRKSQLRLCSVGENNINSRKRKNATSKYKGVSWASRNGKWLCMAGKRGTKKNLGYFVDEIEAARTYNEYAKEHYGSMACLNPV